MFVLVGALPRATRSHLGEELSAPGIGIVDRSLRDINDVLLAEAGYSRLAVPPELDFTDFKPSRDVSNRLRDLSEDIHSGRVAYGFDPAAPFTFRVLAKALPVAGFAFLDDESDLPSQLRGYGTYAAAAARLLQELWTQGWRLGSKSVGTNRTMHIATIADPELELADSPTLNASDIDKDGLARAIARTAVEARLLLAQSLDGPADRRELQAERSRLVDWERRLHVAERDALAVYQHEITRLRVENAYLLTELRDERTR